MNNEIDRKIIVSRGLIIAKTCEKKSENWFYRGSVEILSRK